MVCLVLWNDRASFARLQKLYIVADSKFRAGGGHNGQNRGPLRPRHNFIGD
jgi:hypothetical protein